jgi:hypothetical protein
LTLRGISIVLRPANWNTPPSMTSNHEPTSNVEYPSNLQLAKQHGRITSTISFRPDISSSISSRESKLVGDGRDMAPNECRTLDGMNWIWKRKFRQRYLGE